MPEADCKCPFCTTAVPAGAVICRGCGARYGYVVDGDIYTNVDQAKKLAYAPSRAVTKLPLYMGLIIALPSACTWAMDEHVRGGASVAFAFGVLCLLMTPLVSLFSSTGPSKIFEE